MKKIKKTSRGTAGRSENFLSTLGTPYKKAFAGEEKSMKSRHRHRHRHREYMYIYTVVCTVILKCERVCVYIS
jgi:hypothetical protein